MTGPAAPTRSETRKSDRTRQRILDAAADVLNRRGFDGARLTEIAELAHVRVPTVYYYFDTREALLEEVVMIGVQLAMSNVRARLDQLAPGIGPLERVCTAFGAHLEMVLTASRYTAAAMRTLGSLPPDVRERQLRQQRGYGDLWRGLIAEAVESGHVDPRLDARAARMFLLGAMNWAPEWWDPDRGSLSEIVETAQLLVRNALSPHGPSGRAEPAPALAPAFRPPSASSSALTTDREGPR
ncbi:TetR family transcriptional regulator [Actinomycetospora sp. TBRC 11914]|uniref:TetR/AcrR family transcriptional regulator n=1 Tax=Actinomycetospora sp. TBRC 11914 TaxID=2729387 RepID=UPI00145D4C46|nr:TetR family transcriptional regulator [Actinomycetospora sp. TBRC 11914]NMO91587.1 TetR/AcrR family transcriptional regulator [Actinomycetospora sp. TBRC 11914]